MGLGPLAPVVRSIVELAVHVVTNGSFDTASQQIQKIRGVVARVEPIAHPVEVLALSP